MPAQVNTDMTNVLPCEEAARIAGRLEAQAELGPMRMLYDIAEVIEACAGSHMEVHLDCRQHRNESLLLPGLAAHQGPAICVKLPGAQPNVSFAYLPKDFHHCCSLGQELCLPLLSTMDSCILEASSVRIWLRPAV